MNLPGRYTMSYTATNGKRITLYNLAHAGCEFIQRAQEGLGSHSFERTEQPHNYTQQELDLLKGRAAP